MSDVNLKILEKSLEFAFLLRNYKKKSQKSFYIFNYPRIKKNIKSERKSIKVIRLCQISLIHLYKFRKYVRFMVLPQK